jgi:hypothetical protein
VFHCKMFLPVVGQCFIELTILVIRNLTLWTCPQCFVFVDKLTLMLDCCDLLLFLFFLLAFIFDFYYFFFMTYFGFIFIIANLFFLCFFQYRLIWYPTNSECFLIRSLIFFSSRNSPRSSFR